MPDCFEKRGGSIVKGGLLNMENPVKQRLVIKEVMYSFTLP